MDLIEINGYTPPSPTTYDVSFADINGAEETLESGYDYIEQVRAQVPSIGLAWKNIMETEAAAILFAVRPATFPCKYYFGVMMEDVFKCSNPKLTLKLVNGNTRYYDLSLTLEG